MTKPKMLHPYYDYRKALSHNCVLNFIVGGRGLGKTYGAKRLGIRNCINKGEEFIYLRRYKEELKAARDTFFADIEVEFPKHDARIMGNRGQISPRLVRRKDESDSEWKQRNKDRKWITACYFIALSVAQSQKSVAFPKVTLIIFDEFIIEKATQSRYLNSEVTAFLNFYSTVDRGKDKTRVLLLANSVSIMNPYFAQWNIEPDKMPELSVMFDGFILCHFPDSVQFATSIYQTRFGKFIAGTEYADYAVGNEFKDANAKLIAEKTKDAKYKYSLETPNGIFSVWYDMTTGTYYILSKRPGNERLFTIVTENMDKGKTRISLNEPVLRSLRAAFNRGDLEFDKPASRNAFVPIFDRA